MLFRSTGYGDVIIDGVANYDIILLFPEIFYQRYCGQRIKRIGDSEWYDLIEGILKERLDE